MAKTDVYVDGLSRPFEKEETEDQRKFVRECALR